MVVKEEWYAGPIKITKIYQQAYHRDLAKVEIYYTAQFDGMVSPWQTTEQGAIEFITSTRGVKSA